ncbi:MAG: CapA family protein [Treponema sp.]|jgi:poly-gamma-glutamate synthesis protein (capsule biosynthesis protein)|nr:CapA family protein [Treponema sp.]
MGKFKSPALFLLVFIFYSCSTPPVVIERDDRARTPELPPVIELPAHELAVEPDYITIVAVGDNLIHEQILRASNENGAYSFESIYDNIKSYILPADIAFINQETLLGGEEFGFSGYPQFNTPQTMGDAIMAAGFNVVNHANNHTMDKGEKAVFATMDFWDTNPRITVLGIHRSEEQRSNPKLVKINNITLGFLSYTYGTNGIPVPRDKPYLVSLINREIMAKEIDALRPLCDFLVVSMHWGEEYQHNYSKNQESLAAFLAEQNVDLVIGHHPHVLQPIEYIARPDGKLMLCFYSLGNFFSAQTWNQTLLGAMAYVKIEKNKTQPANIVITEAGAIPLVTHYENNYTGFKVYPLDSYTEELKQKHRNRERNGLTIDYFTGLAAEILKDKEIRGNPFTPQLVHR